MNSNLRERLLRIKDVRKSTAEPGRETVKGSADRSGLKGWDTVGLQTVKRIFNKQGDIFVPSEFPAALPVIIPDLMFSVDQEGAAERKKITPENLLFFDLETTGLSIGAGTLAFLAAFGRLIPGASGRYHLQITQYLLLDYPGESDFIEAVLSEFFDNCVLVTYNGKSFDSQILATRCLMNGIKPPLYFHADLLHPARRLWKRLLGSCSQGNIEEKVLSFDRSGDIPGALAPEIWFNFLRSGNTESLMGVCEHNRRDIFGLASMFAVMTYIAEDPFAAHEKYPYDTENLALRWHDCMRRQTIAYKLCRNEKDSSDLLKTGKAMLQFAADKGGPRAALVLALHLLRAGDPQSSVGDTGSQDDGRKRLAEIAAGAFPDIYRISALRFLAIDAERCLADFSVALGYVNRAMEMDLSETQTAEFERRKARLLGKMKL